MLEPEPEGLPTDAQILNQYAPEQGAGSTAAQYDRTMLYRLRRSLILMSDKLTGVMETIHRVGQLITEQQEKSGAAQSKAQRAANRLSFVVAAATVAYVCVTVWSVTVQLEANSIQRQLLELQQKQQMANAASAPKKP